MYPELTSSDIRDMIIDRVILLSHSQPDDTVTDEIIGMLTALHDRTYSMSDKISEKEYTTSLGVKVTEKEYDTGNIKIVLSTKEHKKDGSK